MASSRIWPMNLNGELSLQQMCHLDFPISNINTYPHHACFYTLDSENSSGMFRHPWAAHYYVKWMTVEQMRASVRNDFPWQSYIFLEQRAKEQLHFRPSFRMRKKKKKKGMVMTCDDAFLQVVTQGLQAAKLRSQKQPPAWSATVWNMEYKWV